MQRPPLKRINQQNQVFKTINLNQKPSQTLKILAEVGFFIAKIHMQVRIRWMCPLV